MRSTGKVDNPLEGETPKVALVVEDDDQIAYLLRFILEREGFKVEAAADGRLANDLVMNRPTPALVLLDVMLPFMDGYQLLAAIRARKDWETVPVLMLTAKSQEKDIVRALDSGAADYMVNPIRPDELRSRIRRLMKESK